MSNETKIVPVEPTEEMISIGVQALYKTRHLSLYQQISAICYKAMLEAAPAPDDELARLQEQLLDVYEAATTGKALVSNQGQSLDGYSELSNYRSILAKMIRLREKDDE